MKVIEFYHEGQWVGNIYVDSFVATGERVVAEVPDGWELMPGLKRSDSDSTDQ